MISEAGPTIMVVLACIIGGWPALLVGHFVQGKPFTLNDSFIFAFPFLMFFTALFLKQKNPMKWWSIFGGTTITVDTKKLVDQERLKGSDEVKHEIADWVNKCSKSGYIKINPFRYKFRRKRDAAIFKLVWG
jgi:predicted neutral ceramidase superfamily lipid hydrolase